ncbi:unnamed protein product [Caenorhabditis angaria]|uniref:Ubiquitin carboxyl-terminal hydrolase 7 n=1 Tax=Caenorhabditis angaria TaxID=860376 RepID=A0A9P1IVJ5_9PELO|nr:unnamed protein product [Caenorhabditis angaria]
MRTTPETEPEDTSLVSPIFNESNDPYGPEGMLYLDIDMFSKFMEKTDNRLLSKPVIVRGVPWRILALCRVPQRTNQGRQPRGYSLGYFLQCNNEDSLPKRGMWRCFGSATLEVLSQTGEHLSKKITHNFHNNEVDWGFTNFESYEVLSNPENGYLENDTLKLRCHFTADVPTGNGYFWDSKLHTGCIGLRNQGATCYMNSILQAFYFTTGFRKTVYQMETGTEPSESNICLAMQRVFYDLQTSNDAVETNSLTRAFGWDKLDAFNQHDVQEFCRVLLDNLETKMKGTSQEQSIPSLFRGNMKSFIKCTDVEYESSRTESFYDVQLNVLGMESLERAFEAYTAIEVLEGDNKYDAGDFGLQRAEKGVKFVELPPVLHVQLMRFQYCGVEQKVNERFTFPEQMDLLNCCELSDQLKKEDCVYSLHAVLVHSGEFHGGHYVTFINTNLHETNSNLDVKPRWCKFDDDVVSRTTIDDAITSNFGGERSMNTSAYMLIYVRNNAISSVLAPIPNEEIPESVSTTFEIERQQRNRMKKKKEEQSMCIELPIVTPNIITGYHGFDLIDKPILDNHVSRECLPKSTSNYQLYRFIEKRLFSSNSHRRSRDSAMDIEDGEDLGSEEEDDEDDDDDFIRKSFRFRLWKMCEKYSSEGGKSLSRFRPDKLLEPFAKETIDKWFLAERDSIYIETPSAYGELQEYTFNDNVLIFVKYYDTTSERFTILGHYVIKHNQRISVYRDIFCKMAGIPPGTQLNYYEEVAANRVSQLENNYSAIDDDGTIIIIEQSDLFEENNNVVAKMDEMYKTTFVEFNEFKFNRNNEELDDILTEPFTKKVKLDAPLSSVAQTLAKELNCDPKNVLIWTKSINGKNEIPQEDVGGKLVINSILGRGLHDPRLAKKYSTCYTIMPFPVSEMDKRQQMKIFEMNDKMMINEMTIFPPKDGTVANILEEASRYFKFAPNGTRKLRLVQVGTTPNFHRVYQIYTDNIPLVDIQSKYLYKCRVEEIPEDELECSPGEFYCPVVHFDRDPTSRLFGTSFIIKVKNGELTNDVRERLRRKLSDVADNEFNKYKFALLARDKLCRYIEFGDSDKVNLQDLSCQTTGNIPQVYIGIDHKSPVLHSNENAIRILN